MSQPDRILDIRVRVPHGWTIDKVTGTGPHGMSAIHHIEAIHPAIDREPKPTFEAGKLYRTRGGDVARIDDIGVAQPGFMIGGIEGAHHSWSWRLDGTINEHGPDSLYDLMPGAIDEPEAEPLTPTDQRIQLLFDGLARVEQRLAKMAEEQAADVRRMNRLSTIIDGVDKAREVLRKDMDERFARTFDRVSEHENRIDRFAIELAGKVNARELAGERVIIDKATGIEIGRIKAAAMQRVAIQLTEGEGL